MATSWEVVILMDMPYTVKVDGRAIRIPFGTRDSADTAAALISIWVREVREDYGPPVVAGEVLREPAGIEEGDDRDYSG